MFWVDSVKEISNFSFLSFGGLGRKNKEASAQRGNVYQKRK